MICLDPQSATLRPDARVMRAIEKRGAIFIWSERLQDWFILARDVETKRRLLERYKSGVAIYAREELPRIDSHNIEFVHNIVAQFGATISA